MKEDIQVAPPKAHFFDSGSFTLWTRAEQYGKEHKGKEWEFYETDEFYQYLEGYVKFVKKYRIGIELCANVDVLPFRGRRKPPKGKDSHSLSYHNLKLLEERGLRPVPVAHYPKRYPELGTTWLRTYIEEGYPLIGLGGLVGSITDKECEEWIDSCFNLICQGTGRPAVKLHGFGVTSHEYLLHYPWYSVDSTTWTKHGAYGHILVPKYRKGRFILSPRDLQEAGLSTLNWRKDCQPWLVTMSEGSKKQQQENSMHYFRLKGREQETIRMWLERIGIQLGCEKKEEPGVITNHNFRRTANLLFFEEVRKSLPDYKDWTWETARRSGFRNMTAELEVPEPKDFHVPKSKKLIIFYSGSASTKSGPEADLKEKANIMLTFHDMHKSGKPDARFGRVVDARKRRNKKLRAKGKPVRSRLACV